MPLVQGPGDETLKERSASTLPTLDNRGLSHQNGSIDSPYDIIEAFHASLSYFDRDSGEDNAAVFANEINEFFIDEGIAWRGRGENSYAGNRSL